METLEASVPDKGYPVGRRAYLQGATARTTTRRRLPIVLRPLRPAIAYWVDLCPGCVLLTAHSPRSIPSRHCVHYYRLLLIRVGSILWFSFPPLSV